MIFSLLNTDVTQLFPLAIAGSHYKMPTLPSAAFRLSAELLVSHLGEPLAV